MISWVAVDRIVERRRGADAGYRKQAAGKVLRSDAKRLTDGDLLAKLHSFGIEMDRPALERLCDQALSAEQIAQRLLDQRTFHGRHEQVESDWIWICLSALWQRWFPDKPSFEALDDKMQAGYELQESGAVAACRVWLQAWSDVLRILDKAGMQSIQEFDERGSKGANRCSTGFRIWKVSCGMRDWRIGSFSPPGSRCAKRVCGAFAPTTT